MLEGIQGVAAQVGSIVVGKNPQIRLAMACNMMDEAALDGVQAFLDQRTRRSA